MYDNENEKINFAGGEPTLSPFLGDLIVYSKTLGLVTSIISNGTGINEKFLRKFGKYLDWIGLSLDSGNEMTQFLLGRGTGDYVQQIISKCKLVKKQGIKLKINTVINKLNYKEDMAWVLYKIDPNRWKVFQALEIKKRNNKNIKNLLISNSEFKFFIENHKELNPVTENNNQMVDSYYMIDPQGRFYQNSNNFYFFSEEILEVGIEKALEHIQFNRKKFLERGGFYF